MPKRDEDAGQINHADEVFGLDFPSDPRSSEALQPGEEPFDSPAALVVAQSSSVLGDSGAGYPKIGRSGTVPRTNEDQ